MTKIVLTTLAGCLVLSGCKTLDITYRKIDGSAPVLQLEAVKEGAQRGGYFFEILRPDGSLVGRYRSEAGKPILVNDLEPAPYVVVVEGERIDREVVDLQLLPGEQTTVSLLVGNARKQYRYGGAAEVVGTVLIYTVGLFFVAVLWVASEMVSSSLCDRCHHDPCRCPPVRPRR